MKKSREEVAYEYLKDAGPCLVTLSDGKAKVLLTADGEAFWLNDENGPSIPFVSLKDVLENAKHLLLTLFTGDIENDLDAQSLFVLENDLRISLKKSELSQEEAREIKIKFLDVKEAMLDN